MPDEPRACIVRVAVEPARRAAAAETVSPGVHVLHQARPADTCKLIGEEDLQETDRGFLEVVTACVAIEAGAPLIAHANDVTGLVQYRMQRRVSTTKYLPADNPRLRLSPEAATNRFVVGHPNGNEAISRQQRIDDCRFQVSQPQYARVVERGVQMPESWIRMTRTRSSTIASRSNCSSSSLPSTRVSSQV